FFALSAVSAGKADLRAIIQKVMPAQARQRNLFGAVADTEPSGTILFLDEIHRFNKAQQDYLLPFVEDGTLTLIGATTENPSFEVNSALLSRMQVFTLNSLTIDDLKQIIGRGIALLNVILDEDGLNFLANYANGDARTALNVLDNAAMLYGQSGEITLENLKETLQSKQLRYDKSGEEHYNTISAFIKSMRASQPDAALYYLARMIDAGEDPKFIARRMVIFASEDVGLGDSNALTVANDVFRAVETIGLPEAQYSLSHGVIYLATAPKSRAADAYWAALDDVKQHGNLPVPLHLRNAPTSLMKELGYGQSRAGADYLPETLSQKCYYQPDE
ncbi:MAG: replication-associated recombination protein A, partial [Aggregatilineales bacterium]